MNIENDLEMCQSVRNETSMMVGMDKCFKSPLVDGA